MDGPLTGPEVQTTRAPLEKMAASDAAGPRLARLDRLLDLLDAARFSGDAHARETLWQALGGNAISQGHEATREAASRMLQEAWAIEDAHPDLEGDAQQFLADLIMLLSVDLHLPSDAESLSIQTLAYRSLVEQGHPRIADNATWRVYDHLRGVMVGAVEAPAERRMDVAVHALYAEHDDISAWLADTAPHSRPDYPAPDTLWGMVEAQRARLAEHDGWKPLVDARTAQDEALRETVLAVLPEARDPAWALADVERGTARPESLAPVLLLETGSAVLEPGRAGAKKLSAVSPELPRSLERVLARDGRGTVLMAAEPMLPSPELAGAMRALAAARVAVIELAVREPRVDDDERGVIVALPLQVARPDDVGAGARAFREARIRVHLDGRGPRVSVDGEWLAAEPASPAELRELMQQVSRAYPRERIVGLTMSANILHQQLLDLLIQLEGGAREPLFAAVGWVAGSGELPPEGGKADALVELRASLYSPEGAPPALSQAFPFTKADQNRIEQWSKQLGLCLPELESRPKGPVRLELSFVEGRLSDITVGKGVKKKHHAALRECVEDLAYGFRLREHRDPASVGVVLPTPPKR